MPHSIAHSHRRRHAVWIATLIATSSLAGPATGQSASIGADIVNRYVWRGIDFGESMSVQPALTFGVGGFEFGAWGSYSISASGSDANENDLWASFTHELASGASISVGVTDYYFPAPGGDGFLKGDAHTQEFFASLSGPESLPVSLLAAIVQDTRDDEDTYTLYVEAGLSLPTIEGVELGAHAGMVGGKSNFYGTPGASLVNLGVTASKALQITDSFAPPVSVSYILNTVANYTETAEGIEKEARAYLVFALSLAP